MIRSPIVTHAEPAQLSTAATAGWGLLILALTAAVHGLTAAAMTPADATPVGLRDDGLIFSVGILASALAGAAATLAVLRRRSPRTYLALVWPRVASLALWIAIAALTAAALDGVTHLLGRPLIPEAWFATFHGARSLPLLLLALVVVAPVYEEMYFRGFLHRGLASSRLGPAGAVAVVALLFSLAHFPEDGWSFAQGLTTGALLGAARQHTGSLVPCIVVHALLNAKVMLQLALGGPG